MDRYDEARQLRLGLVGCGWISDWHGRAAALIPGVDVVACCDVRLDAAEAWRERHGCERAYSDHMTMIREHDLDGVILTTWPSDHRQQILGCLEAGIRNVLCEKSLVVGTGEALEIWEAAREAGALVVEGFMYRHHPAVRKVDELVAAGEVGTIDNVYASHDYYDSEEASPDDPSRNWRQRKEACGGVPYDLLCYCVDVCNHYAGALPLQALAVARTSERYGTVTRIYGELEYENGVVGTVSASMKSAFNYEVKISGASGQLVMPVAWSPDRIPPREGPEEGETTEILLRRKVGPFQVETHAVSVPAADPYRHQLENFVAAVRGAATPTPTLAESVVNAFAIDALLTSGADGSARPVEIPKSVRAAHDSGR